MESHIDYEKLHSRIEENLNSKAIPALVNFVRVPNVSKHFDKEWRTNGLFKKAAQVCLDYSKEMNIEGLVLDYYEDEGKTPFIFGTVPASNAVTKERPYTVMFYGHLDKQPPMAEKWRQGLHPYEPVIEDEKLYGRGGADDGYNFFSVLSIIKSLQEAKVPHGKMVLFYEFDEESGSDDIIHYLRKFRDRMGEVDMILILDTSSISTNHFTIMSSLKGLVSFDLKVSVLDKSIHSGFTGTAPSSFRIARQLLDRIEDSKTGVMMPELQTEIPADKYQFVKDLVEIMGQTVLTTLPFLPGVDQGISPLEAYLNRSWRPQLELIGQDNIPKLDIAGNVLRDHTLLRFNIRIPPTLSSDQAFEAVKKKLEENPPYNVKVEVTDVGSVTGVNCKAIPEGVQSIIDKHSLKVFGSKLVAAANGGTIGFVKQIAEEMPNSLILITGATLPTSLIHGPNENLDLAFLRRYCKVIGGILADCELRHSAVSSGAEPKKN